MQAGNIEATSGMSKAIYDAMEANMSDAFPDGVPDVVQEGWKKLAFCIATGVVDHIKSNMDVDGTTAAGGADNHTHTVSLSAQ
jgi:hypothetical protein